MGGSAIGGLLARAALGDSLALPMLIFRDYELPPWTSPDRAILCSSYSGDTEETLACFEAAEAIGATRYVMTTGALADAARRPTCPWSGCRPDCSLATASATVHGRLRGGGARGRCARHADRDRHRSGTPRPGADALAARAAEIADRLADNTP